MTKNLNRLKAKKRITAAVAIAALGVAIAPILASCVGPIEGLNPETIVNLVFPNVWVFVGQLISMTILFVMILMFVWKPTNKMIERRKKLILAEIDEAVNDKKLAKQELEAAKKKNLEASVRANELLAEANSQSVALKEEILKGAHDEARKIIDGANQVLARDLEKAQQNLNGQVIDMALKATESLMRRKVDVQDDRQAIEEFIQTLKVGKH